MKRRGFLAGLAALIVAPAIAIGLKKNQTRDNKSVFSYLSSYDLFELDYHKKLIKKIPRYSTKEWLKAIRGKKRKMDKYTYFFE